MVANEVQLEPIISEDNRSDDQWANDDYYDEEGEADETLSLCDLPIYSGSEDRSSSSKEDYQSSSDDQDDLFEFFSQDLSTSSSSSSSTCAYAENIFFCGKLLPYKIPALLSQETTHKLHQTNTQQPPPPPKKKKSFFQWRSKSLNKSNTTKNQINSNHKKNYSEHQKISNKKYGYSVKKVSILMSPTKSRWHMFLFGLAKFPTEMKLSDMRSRQHRRTPSSTMGKEIKDGGGKGLWRLLRGLGCRNSHANTTVVKASFGCIPRL